MINKSEIAMLTTKIINELEECKKYWDIFTEKKYLFDFWDYRACFYFPGNCILNFILALDDGKPVALMPLWKEKGKGYHEFFGGEFAERNRFMLSPDYRTKKMVESILKKLPPKTYLPYIDQSEISLAELNECEKRYFLELEKFNFSFDNYVNSFSKKHRKNFRRDIRLFDERHPVVRHNRIENLDRMFELNRERFYEGSFFAGEFFSSGFRNLVGIASKNGELNMISIEIEGQVEAVEVAVLKNGIYYVLMGGNNLKISNIGKYLTSEHIKNAISKGAKLVDFLSTDSNWKELWNFTSEQTYEYCNFDIDKLHRQEK